MSRLDKEPQKTFAFKDTYGRWEMPLGLKEIIDALFRENKITLIMNFYLTRLAHVAGAQQDARKGKEDNPFIPNVRKGQDPVESSIVWESYARKFEGVEGMATLIEARNGVIDVVGLETVRQLESYLKVDSAGLEAGDPKPLLGVDMNIARALHHYVIRADGYEEIKGGWRGWLRGST